GEGVEAGVHARIHLRVRDEGWTEEVGRIEGIGNAHRERGKILVHDGDGRLVQGLGYRRGSGVDGKGEGIDDQDQHDRIAQEATQFLHAEVQNVGEAAHWLALLLSEQENAETYE